MYVFYLPRIAVSSLILPIDKAGDRICLFGFSRGAYTARCIAEMLNKVIPSVLLTLGF